MKAKILISLSFIRLGIIVLGIYFLSANIFNPEENVIPKYGTELALGCIVLWIILWVIGKYLKKSGADNQFFD